MKSLHPHRCRFLHRDSADLGVGRTYSQFAFEVFELMAGADGQHLHPAVVQITGPPADADIAGRPLREVPVANSLHLAGDIVSPRQTCPHKP